MPHRVRALPICLQTKLQFFLIQASKQIWRKSLPRVDSLATDEVGYPPAHPYPIVAASLATLHRVQMSVLTLVVVEFFFDLSVHTSCTHRLLTD
jgi:hypothetical protein